MKFRLNFCVQKERRITDSSYLNAIIVENEEFGLDLLREILKYGNGRLVEEAVARNTVVTEELNKTKDEIVELQRLSKSCRSGENH